MRLRTCLYIFAVCSLSPVVYADGMAPQPSSIIDLPIYSGGLYGSLAGYWAKPTASNGDQQYGTNVVSKSVEPNPLPSPFPNRLNARNLNITPDYQWGYIGNIGYRFPNTSWNLNFEYLYYNPSDSDHVGPFDFNQSVQSFIQNFLGGSFLSAIANEDQRFQKMDLSAGKSWIIDKSLNIHTFFGLEYVNLHRDIDLTYNELIPNPIIDTPAPSQLDGVEKSSFHGLGPLLGVDFKYPIKNGFNFLSKVSSSVLIGDLNSSLNSVVFRNDRYRPFSANSSSDNAAVPSIATSMGLNYYFPFNHKRSSVEIEAGYSISYYFDAIERLINPTQGIINNPTPSVQQVATGFGMEGPYLKVTVSDTSIKSLQNVLNRTNDTFGNRYFVSVTNLWLLPLPEGDDSRYAIWHDGTNTNNTDGIHINPSAAWAGSLSLGYFIPNTNADIRINYFHLNSEDSDFNTTPAPNFFTPLNSNGTTTDAYRVVGAIIQYNINQYDLTAGMNLQVSAPLNLHLYNGLRFLNLRRHLQTFYETSFNLDYATKYPHLNSRFQGIGPLFGIDVGYQLISDFNILGHFDTGLLVGDINSTLDMQAYTLTAVPGQQTHLRTLDFLSIVPVLDAKLGIAWLHKSQNTKIGAELGYQFSEYFKSVSLVYPNLLTGIQQYNTNLPLDGPYLTLSLAY